MSLLIIKKVTWSCFSRKSLYNRACSGWPPKPQRRTHQQTWCVRVKGSANVKNNIWPVWAKSPQSCPWWLYEVAEAEGTTASSVIGPVVVIVTVITVIIIIIKRPALALPITASVIIAVVPKTLLTDNVLQPTLAMNQCFAIQQQIVLHIFEDSGTVLHSHSIWLGGKKIEERHP